MHGVSVLSTAAMAANTARSDICKTFLVGWCRKLSSYYVALAQHSAYKQVWLHASHNGCITEQAQIILVDSVGSVFAIACTEAEEGCLLAGSVLSLGWLCNVAVAQSHSLTVLPASNCFKLTWSWFDAWCLLETLSAGLSCLALVVANREGKICSIQACSLCNCNLRDNGHGKDCLSLSSLQCELVLPRSSQTKMGRSSMPIASGLNVCVIYLLRYTGSVWSLPTYGIASSVMHVTLQRVLVTW